MLSFALAFPVKGSTTERKYSSARCIPPEALGGPKKLGGLDDWRGNSVVGRDVGAAAERCCRARLAVCWGCAAGESIAGGVDGGGTSAAQKATQKRSVG